MMEYELTQADVGKLLGLSQATVSQRFSGKTSWTIKEVWTLIRKLRISAEEMHLYFPENGELPVEEVAA